MDNVYEFFFFNFLGQGIPPHVDNHNCCDDTILSLSLGSDVIMNFVHLDDLDRTEPIIVNLPARSLMIMSQEARYIYTHGIVPRKSDIIKVTNCESQCGNLTNLPSLRFYVKSIF